MAMFGALCVRWAARGLLAPRVAPVEAAAAVRGVHVTSASRSSSDENRLNVRLDGKRALVTGAGKGIGRQCAKQLSAMGAHVIALTHTQDDLDSLMKEIPITPIQVDLSDLAAIPASLEAAGDVDIVVNNAGISELKPFLDTSVSSFNTIMAVNCTAVMVVSQYAAKSMIARGVGGSIVNVSSQASKVGLADHTAYCASKGAVDNLTRVMAKELGPKGIRCNCVNPTVVLTEMGKMAWSDPVKAKPMLDMIPLGRFCEVEEVVDVICYLASDRASMVNGVMVPVDGGFLAT